MLLISRAFLSEGILFIRLSHQLLSGSVLAPFVIQFPDFSRVQSQHKKHDHRRKSDRHKIGQIKQTAAGRHFNSFGKYSG